MEEFYHSVHLDSSLCKGCINCIKRCPTQAIRVHNGKAVIKKSFCIYCDIPDESGAIATIATILASNAINIKNIGIIHNREFEEGVLRIEFYDGDSLERASALLQRHRYIIYER